ncbi:hypothetical protein ACVIGA_001086 [Bradyrhizobium sp. USDA 3240]
MNANEARLARNTALAVCALVVLRLAAAAWTPLTFDEAYYWMWSKALAGGYYDHPPMVAVVIRLGTMIAGDTPFGVRLVSILLALPMSWAIYRAAEILFGGRRIAASATILLNVTLMAAVGTLIVTPDAPLLVAASFLLYSLAKVLESGRGAWWLAVGVSAGLALLSKYTALFFGPAILIWLAVVPKLRRWYLSPWLYLGGLVAVGLFAPVILWNADHHWVSFIKQMGRARIEDFRPNYIAELIPTQFAFATPLVFILGVMGLYALYRRRAGAMPARVLVNTMFWTIVVYFTWHALHARVEANWFAPGLSGLCGGGRGRGDPGAVGAARAAHDRFLPPLGRAHRRRAVRAADRAGQHRHALGLSPRRHRAQRRRRLAGARGRDRGGARAHRRDLRAVAGLRHHRLACLLSPQGHLRRPAGPAHSLGQYARAEPGATGRQAAVCARGRAADAGLGARQFRPCRNGGRGQTHAWAAGDRELRARSA